jgi:NTP pyrophosphatase (non-canonical NTP hydrolase)
MTREAIVEILEKTNVSDWNEEKAKKISQKSIEYVQQVSTGQLAIAYEELAELEQVLTKEIRGKGDKYAAIEEIADVYLGIMFINEVYKIDIDVSKKYSCSEEVSLFYSLRALSNLQNSVLDAILLNNKTTLRDNCLEVLHCLVTIKEHFGISEDEIIKMKTYKMKRLEERMQTKTLI